MLSFFSLSDFLPSSTYHKLHLSQIFSIIITMASSAAPNHAEKLAKGLHNLKKRRQLTDITIKIGKRSFEAHKAVLAADSDYFLDMFTHGFKESAESKIKIDGKPQFFQVLLDFTYTGELEITIQTASDVLEMACYMQLRDAIEECAKFIKSQLDLSLKAQFRYRKPDEEALSKHKIEISDAFKICNLASRHDSDCMKQLAKESAKYLCAYFQELLECSDLLEETASYEFLEHFLRQEDLASDEEEEEVSASGIVGPLWIFSTHLTEHNSRGELGLHL